jgi:hypothetical protein
MNSPDEPLELKLKPRPAKAVTVSIPTDTLKDLQQVAETRDMSVEGLIKFYLGQGLRADLTQLRSAQTRSDRHGASQMPRL